MAQNTTNTWTGPSATAPAQNKQVVLNASSLGQKKGGDGLPTPGVLLDVAGSLKSNNLAVWNSATTYDLYLQSLNNGSTPVPLCIDENHKLNTTTCSSSSGNIANVYFSANAVNSQINSATINSANFSGVTWPVVYPQRDVLGTTSDSTASTLSLNITVSSAGDHHVKVTNNVYDVCLPVSGPVTNFSTGNHFSPINITALSDTYVTLNSGECK